MLHCITGSVVHQWEIIRHLNGTDTLKIWEIITLIVKYTDMNKTKISVNYTSERVHIQDK